MRREGRIPTGSFSAPRRSGLREGEAVHLIVDGCETVTVVAGIQPPGHAKLTVQENLGLTVPFAVLVRDDSYLIEALRDRLRNARRRTSPFHWSMAEALLDPKRWVRPVGLRSGLSHHLNPEQAGAVGCMAEEGVVVIWGPPGTGKTRVLAAGAAASWQAERTVYLLAHTNVAVDNLLERFLEQLEGADWGDGQIVRLGDIVSESLDTRFGERVAFNAVVRRQREPLEAELHRIGLEISEVRVSLLKADEAGESRPDEVAALSHRLDSLQAEAAEVERAHAAVPAAVLDEARVVATTIHRAYLPGYLHRPADVVIVDEASVVPFPAAFFAAGLATRTAVYAGDPLQLGTITQSSAPAVQKWVSSNVFRPPDAPGSSPPEPILLRRQYRMPKEVADLLNAISYRRGTLITPHGSGIRSTAVEDVLPGGRHLRRHLGSSPRCTDSQRNTHARERGPRAAGHSPPATGRRDSWRNLRCRDHSLLGPGPPDPAPPPT